MVKNRLMGLLVVALALGLSATSVFAQGQGQGGRGGRGGFGMGFGGGQRDVLSLISNEAVVKELAVSDDVTAKLKKVSDDYRADLRKGFGEGGFNPDASETERAERRKKMEEATKTARETYLPKVKEILTPEQYTRVQQISYQASGVAAFTDPEVIKALDLTKEQQDKIATANKAAGDKTRELFAAGAGGGQGNREKMQEINKARDTEVAKWTALKGKEFDVAKLRPMGGPGGGRGRRPAAN
jgi:Spy/CpxP family protein refolding chaperone